MPASRGGVREGDLIELANGNELEHPDRPEVEAGEGLVLTVLRGGRRLELEHRRGCAYSHLLVAMDAANAFAQPRTGRVGVTVGMLRVQPDDAPLAVVLGHELAHNYLRSSHLSRSRRLKTRRNLELRADYIGAHIAARAGYELSGKELDFYSDDPFGLSDAYTATHPASPVRTLRYDETIEEIQRKTQLGEPLALGGALD